ncbi:MAG: M56 family metallopeptidase [Planctomycetota bacterium]
MISLVETGLMNALLAVVLALPVLALGRFWHRPALVHAFWILVLVKLVAPPLYFVPVQWRLPSAQSSQIVRRVVAPADVAQSGQFSKGQVQGQQGPVLPTASRSADTARGIRRNLQSTWTIDYWSVAGTALRFLRQLILPGLCLWLCGSLCWFTWQGWQIVRFTQVFLKYARLGPRALQKLTHRLAGPMGLSHAPEVWLLPAVVSPMLWSVGGKSRILFPTDLLNRLDEGAVATLLTHELAHYRRGDHYVRLLEFLASGLFWWHPIIWLARQELEISEEKCCDAWVVSQFPAAQRQYADALLATVDFLAEDHAAVPSVACGLGEVPLLRQRLRLIMCGTAPKSLSVCGRAAVVATAMLIPISPSLRLPPDQPPVVEAATRSGVTASPAAIRVPELLPAKLPTPVEVASVAPLGCGDSIKPSGEPATAAVATAESTSKPSEVTVSASGDAPNLAPKFTAFRYVRRALGQPDEREVSPQPDLDDLVDFVTCHARSVLFMADGKISVTGTRAGSIRVWSLQNVSLTAAEATTVPGPGCESVSDVEAASTPVIERPLFVADWCLDPQRQMAPATMSPLGVNSLSISLRGLTLATSFNAWPTRKSELPPQCEQDEVLKVAPPAPYFTGPVSVALRFTTRGRLYVVTDWNGKLLSWDFGSSVRLR